MTGHLLRRLLGLSGVLLAVSVLAFGVTALAPGDPAYAVLARQQPGATPSAASVALLHRELGLDEPLPQRYARWLGATLHGDLGLSYRSGRPVAAELADRVPATLELAGASLALSLLVGLPLGALAAVRRGSAWDTATRLVVLVGASVPTYVLSLLLVLVFAVRLEVLPAFGSAGPAGLVLPAVALGAAPLAQFAQLARAGLLEVLGQDYVRTAVAKGLSPRRVLLSHASRAAALPVLTVAAVVAGQLLGGAVVVETVFGWNGIGRYAVEAVLLRDHPAVQGVVLVVATAVVLLNLAVDLLHPVVDARLRPP